MQSLGWRLTASLTLSLFLYFAIQSSLASLEVQILSERVIESRLEHDMEEVIAALYIRSNGQFQVNWQRIPHIYRRSASGHYFIIHTDSGEIRSRSLWHLPRMHLSSGFHHEVLGDQQKPLSIHAQSFNFYGHDIQIYIAEETTLIQQTVRAFQSHMFPVFALMMILLLAMQLWIIRSSLQPLVKLRGEVKRLERGEVQQLVIDVPSEIQPMIDEVNQLLQLQMQRVQRSRHALGNMAHALKTPLTLMSQLLEQDLANNKQRLHQQLAIIQERIDRDLARARLAGQVHGGIWPTPHRDIKDLIATLNMIYQDKTHITLELEEPLRIPADREDMMEILGNVLDNACKWSKHQVCCHVWCESGLHIQVEDDGEGMLPKEMQQILQRGVRLDEAVSGHGLGMSIVQEVVDAYAGTLKLSRSEKLGGLKVHVHLFQDESCGDDD